VDEVKAMTEIRIIDLFGPYGGSMDDGADLCDQIRAVLDRGETVCLDFSGVTRPSFPFLGPAIGPLYASFTKDDLEKRLLWKDLDNLHDHMMREIQRKAILFYSASPEIQEQLLGIDRRLMELD
jgi:hypothetical protein